MQVIAKVLEVLNFSECVTIPRSYYKDQSRNYESESKEESSVSFPYSTPPHPQGSDCVLSLFCLSVCLLAVYQIGANVKIIENIILPTIFYGSPSKLNNVLYLGGHDNLGWLRIWPWPDLYCYAQDQSWPLTLQW